MFYKPVIKLYNHTQYSVHLIFDNGFQPMLPCRKAVYPHYSIASVFGFKRQKYALNAAKIVIGVQAAGKCDRHHK